MAAARADDVDKVIERVRSWPAETRLALAQGILATLQGDITEKTARTRNPGSLLGLLRTGSPHPGDEETQRLLEEELLEKYVR